MRTRLRSLLAAPTSAVSAPSAPARPKSSSRAALLGVAALLVGLASPDARAADERAPASTSRAATPTPDERPGATGSSPQTRRFALVIGSNATLSAKQSPLRFADDDAARMTELLRELGVEVALTTSLDRDSQAVFTSLVGEARPPTREQVLAAHERLVARMRRARVTMPGPIEYLIYYSGHGDVGPDGKGFLTLASGDKLSRHDLFVELLGSSPADHNHIVIDACKSEEFVLARGGDWKPDRTDVDYSNAVRAYLDRSHLGHFPNTGVVLASSADQQTHEWERYRGGIFTHELLSGLRGGADINGDGHIEYSELGAFVSAANSGVSDPRARLRVVVRPPRDNERLPLVSHKRLDKDRVLLFTQGDAHRYTVEDRRGVRLADVRRSGEQPGYLRLPPGEVFVYRESQRAGEGGESGAGEPVVEGRIGPEQRSVILARDLHFAPKQRASRGALDVAFRDGLFAVPYGVGYYSGYADRTGMLAVQDPEWKVRVWREVDGELVEVTEGGVDASGQPAPEGPQPEDQCYGDACDDAWDDVWDEEGDDDWEEWIWRPERFWGAISVGMIFAPSSPEREIQLTNNEQKINASQTQPWYSPIRGFDVAWQGFTVRRKKYPVWVGYLRSGYTRGTATFAPKQGSDGFTGGQATRMTYGAVPLYFGGNFYLFNNFPVRPFAGLGFGLDVLTQDYERHKRDNVKDTRARPGFELHAGVEARITNYMALRGEVQQLWAAKSSFDNLPNFSNTNFTVVASLAFGFPLYNKNKRARLEEERRREREKARRREARERRAANSRVPEGKVRVEITRGDERVIVESDSPNSPERTGHAGQPAPAPATPAQPPAYSAPTSPPAQPPAYPPPPSPAPAAPPPAAPPPGR